MKGLKIVVVVCLLILLLSVWIKALSVFDSIKIGQAEPATTLPTSSKLTVMDPDILLDDHEKPVVIATNAPPLVSTPPPYITAESYLVANLETGERYIEYFPSRVFSIASVSKIYTALVVHHLGNLQTPIIIDQVALDILGNSASLLLGEKLMPTDLLHALLMESSNDAAEALAQSFGYDKFIEQMNGFAQEIGMKSTSFHDPSGLTYRNVSTVNDLFVLSKFLYKSEPEILKISRTKVYDMATTTDHGFHHWTNTNFFSSNDEFVGGKTGRTTEAKEAMLTIFNQKVGDKQYPIAIIVLRSNMGERELNTKKLLDMFTDKIGKK